MRPLYSDSIALSLKVFPFNSFVRNNYLLCKRLGLWSYQVGCILKADNARTRLSGLKKRERERGIRGGIASTIYLNAVIALTVLIC